MILRLLNPQGIVGIAASLALALLLVVQKTETRHWKAQSSHFEQLYGQEQAALTTTVAGYRAAADRARAEDAVNLKRVAADQHAINERTANDYQARIAAAHAVAERVRNEAASAAADLGSGGASAVSRLPPAARGTAEGSGEDRFPGDERLMATEQAIQLDELIKWARRQHEVDPQGNR